MKSLSAPAKNITDGSISRGIFRLALPAMVSMVSIMLYEFVDLFWIGNLGAEAVAALGASAFAVWTIKSVSNCVAAGLNALIFICGSISMDNIFRAMATRLFP